MQFPFVGPSYPARSTVIDGQRSINLYPEVAAGGSSKSVAALIGTPGHRLWLTLAGGGIRGLLRFNADTLVAVAGGNVYRVTAAGVSTLIGTVAPGDTPVSMASNGQVIMLVTGAAGYVVNTAGAGSVVQITDPAFSGADRVAFLDGYFVFNKPSAGQFQITGLYATTIDALDFATAEGAPDNLVSLIVDHRELWLFGEATTEVFYNSGAADFPIERISGAFIEHGCAAAQSPAKLDNTVFWLGADENGARVVYRAAGYQPQRVSTHAVEAAIASYARVDDAIAYTYQQEGHSFYVLSFPTANATWAYDAATDMWHERASRHTDGTLRRIRSQCHAAFAGGNVVGDWETGALYFLDLNHFTDAGAPIPRIRIAPHVADPDYREISFHALQIDMETGVGLVSGQGSNPQAMLQWSDDGGRSWGNEHWASIGRLGERLSRVRWRRLGSSRDRVFKVTVTDPVKVVIVGASLEASAGDH